MSGTKKSGRSPAVKRDPKWFRQEFDRIGSEIDEARSQELRPKHLLVRAHRSSIRAARLVISGVNVGLFDDCPHLRAELWNFWSGKINGEQGSIRFDDNGRWHVNVVAKTAKDNGAPLPVGSADDERLARLWVLPIMPFVKHLRPIFFNAQAGAYDWKTIERDSAGRFLGKDGKPLRLIRSRLIDPETGDRYLNWHLQVEPAYVGDNYDDTDWAAHGRRQVGDWADACRALADLLRTKRTAPKNKSRKRTKRTEPVNNDRKALEQGGVTINTINTEKLVMGDEFHGIKGSTIVNRSQVDDSFNRTGLKDSSKGAVAGSPGRMRRIASWGSKHIIAPLIDKVIGGVLRLLGLG